MQELADLPLPVIAAIHGPCLGGGLELALACTGRICTLNDCTRLGLPEVQLGLLPGCGGTQRLPRLIGPSRALNLILTGKTLRPREALKLGLVDDVVPQSILLETAVEMVLQGKVKPRRWPWRERWLKAQPVRQLFFKIVLKRVLAKVRGNYPAIPAIISVVRAGFEQGNTAGQAAEACAFGELTMTPQSAALRSLFFATAAIKHEQDGNVKTYPINQLGVLGGGLMGGGIAFVAASKAGLLVRIKDIQSQGISYALRYSWDLLTREVKLCHISPAERNRKMGLITGSTDYRGFSRCDMVIEAVFEDLALKQQMVKEIEQHAATNTLFASNTSSLSIAQIAAKAERPQQVIGIHFLSPADKMPLVEIIPHAGTSQATIASAISLVRRMGKTPIVVADSTGFYVNRIMALYINEALRCVLEGGTNRACRRGAGKFWFSCRATSSY